VAERQAVAWIKTLAGRIDAVIFCDFGYGTITAGLLEQLRPVLAQRRPIITADVSGQRGRLLAFRDATLLCPTERELRLALHDFENGLSNVAWQALDVTQTRHMLVTLGKKGIVVFDRQSQDPASPQWRQRLRSEYLSSLATRVTDPLGCGDALLAVSTLALAAGGNLMQAAYLGSAAAAIEIDHLGNVPLEQATLQRWLAGRMELGDRRVTRTPPAGLHATTTERRVGRQRFRLPVVSEISAGPPVPPQARDRNTTQAPVIPTTHEP